MSVERGEVKRSGAIGRRGHPAGGEKEKRLEKGRREAAGRRGIQEKGRVVARRQRAGGVVAEGAATSVGAEKRGRRRRKGKGAKGTKGTGVEAARCGRGVAGEARASRGERGAGRSTGRKGRPRRSRAGGPKATSGADGNQSPRGSLIGCVRGLAPGGPGLRPATSPNPSRGGGRGGGRPAPSVRKQGGTGTSPPSRVRPSGFRVTSCPPRGRAAVSRGCTCPPCTFVPPRARSRTSSPAGPRTWSSARHGLCAALS